MESVRINTYFVDCVFIFEANVYSVEVGIPLNGYYGLRKERLNVNLLDIEYDLPRLQFPNIENIADQPHKPLAVSMRDCN